MAQPKPDLQAYCLLLGPLALQYRSQLQQSPGLHLLLKQHLFLQLLLHLLHFLQAHCLHRLQEAAALLLSALLLATPCQLQGQGWVPELLAAPSAALSASLLLLLLLLAPGTSLTALSVQSGLGRLPGQRRCLRLRRLLRVLRLHQWSLLLCRRCLLSSCKRAGPGTEPAGTWMEEK